MTILPKPASRRKKITRKKHYWKNCQVSENSKNDIRTTPNKPYRTKRKLSTPKSRSQDLFIDMESDCQTPYCMTLCSKIVVMYVFSISGLYYDD
jgi:hypothetical protein